MKIILKEDVHKLGQKGDVVEVKPGFARNYLMPQKLAILFTEQQQKSFEEANRVEERKLERQKDSLNSVLKELEKLDLSLKMKSEEGDKLFGSVTKIDIAKLLDENGITIDKKYIILSSPIKTLGEHKIDIVFTSELSGSFNLLLGSIQDSRQKMNNFIGFGSDLRYTIFSRFGITGATSFTLPVLFPFRRDDEDHFVSSIFSDPSINGNLSIQINSKMDIVFSMNHI